MGAVTPETCRVVLQWINICILLHLLDFLFTLNPQFSQLRKILYLKVKKIVGHQHFHINTHLKKSDNGEILNSRAETRSRQICTEMSAVWTVSGSVCRQANCMYVCNISHPDVFIYTYTIQRISQTPQFFYINYYFRETCFDCFWVIFRPS